MIGKSYDGTPANGVAATRVDGSPRHGVAVASWGVAGS